VCELSDPTCLATCGGFAVCGNGVAERGEVCDDGNTTNAGTCNASCGGYTTCGDGVTQSPNGA
jgi:cysteine-rich repeat protein